MAVAAQFEMHWPVRHWDMLAAAMLAGGKCVEMGKNVLRYRMGNLKLQNIDCLKC